MQPGESAPAVSVIIPSHDPGRFIEATLDSVFAQTFADFEVIVVDDGSADGTPARVRKYKDRRLRLAEQRNAGPTAAQNTGLGLARGTLIGFLDHDDLWDRTKLARHVEFLESHPEADLTFSWSRLIDELGRRLGLHTRHWTGPLSFDEMLSDFVIGNTSAVVMRRSALDRAGWFDPELARYYDMELFLRVALLGPNNVHAIPAELTFYRRHSGQMSRDWRGMAADWGRMLGKIRTRAGRERDGVERQAGTNMYRYFAFLAYEQREFGQACRLLRQSYRRKPAGFVADPRSWKMAAASLAGLVLPGRLHRTLERLAGVRAASQEQSMRDERANGAGQ